ncbi:MAG: dodecin domain-containing protein [Chloroflexi bacterium]|nr:MAG: dodecin domain-containing protein [Chloroflexota bacterium]
MAIVKVIEVLSQSNISWEDATQQALIEARKTIRNIQTIYIENFQAVVEDDQQTLVYRVNAKITFVVEG